MEYNDLLLLVLFLLLYSWFTYAVDVVIDVEMGAVANDDDEEESLKSILCKIT